MTWEVALQYEPGSRFVVARDVEGDTLWAVLSVLAEDHWQDLTPPAYTPEERRALARLADRLGAAPVPRSKPPGIMVTRSDWTPEARVSRWESEFYDVDRAGRRRRRYKKPLIERQWEDFVKAAKAEARLVRADAKTGTECRECGDRWSATAADYGLHHECGKGLVDDASQDR